MATKPYTIMANSTEVSSTDWSDRTIGSKMPRNGAIARSVDR